MTRQEFNQQHPTGEQLTMIHYDFQTKERTAQPAVVIGTMQNPKYPDDPDEFLIRIRFTEKKQEFTMCQGSFAMFSNINNL